MQPKRAVLLVLQLHRLLLAVTRRVWAGCGGCTRSHLGHPAPRLGAGRPPQGPLLGPADFLKEATGGGAPTGRASGRPSPRGQERTCQSLGSAPFCPQLPDRRAATQSLKFRPGQDAPGRPQSQSFRDTQSPGLAYLVVCWAQPGPATDVTTVKN